jgi:hypothetical protein
VIKFVSDLRHVGGFSPGIPLSSTKKADRHDIAEILSKVALSNINQTKPFAQYLFDLGTQKRPLLGKNHRQCCYYFSH